ncbi:integral membrane sensor signal transduction histidine kinase [Denitrovibrio acetiphilus DSM 12809]|uniref:histidine kinase n=1 Tax=Denitrovibrio acetiphilus (strain DSM 12809 / NBRC 114555 / N2460) TaxID=522772 RepID=D4H2E7_DENA2|nr:HAMP domain-containing sensor histidine kinase [Denitrovibrio acetiphilus]ADD68938.1 integral membrane sensor signal transduction histidine kinase [Denitrovibrio acetiphilus DSM 12809]
MDFIGSSLRLKIVLVFSGFSILLGMALFVGIFISTKYTEEYALKKRLELETSRYLESVDTSPVAPVAFSRDITVPESPYMTTYIGEDIMPEWAATTLSDRPAGDYEEEHDKQHYYVSIRDLQDGRRFYLLFNVTTLINDHVILNLSRGLLIAMMLPIFIFGLLLGIITSYKAVSPVVRLTRMIKAKEATGVLPENMSQMFENDEVGYLAKTLESAISEMQSSINREKAFARDASHELRTPVTVLQGAIKILSCGINDNEEKRERAISRIKRATNNMEHLINSFLWLSRQERQEEWGSVSAAVVVRECVDNNSYLIRNKPLKVIIDVHSNATLSVTPEILSVVVGNLVRNAVTYTPRGKVVVSIYETCISVRDEGPGIPKHVLDAINVVEGVSKADGFGFGLSIAHRMCTQVGWKLNIISEEGKGANVIVCFNNKDHDFVCPDLCRQLHNTVTEG